MRPYKLKPSDVLYVLTSTDSSVQLSKELKVSRQCINQIRLGITYKNIAPEIIRKTKAGKQCNSCAHWSEEQGCSLGVPEARTDPFFAQECNYFE